MFKFLNRFTRKARPDPLRLLREEPAWELRAAELAQIEADYLIEALQRERVVSHPASNADPGTFGAALVWACRDGLMRCTEHSLDRMVYEITQKGRAYLVVNSRP